MEEDQNYPYYVLVGALNEKGKRAEYSTPGPNIWISAPGGSGKDTGQKVITTSMKGCNSPDLKEWIDIYKKHDSRLDDVTASEVWDDKFLRDQILQIFTNAGLLNKFDWNNESENKNCNYTASLEGTSFATPIVSGAIALILEANPDLNWRQVKLILAATAKKIDDDEGRFDKDVPQSDLNKDEHYMDNILKQWDSQKEHPGIKDFESYEDRFTLAANIKYRQGWILRPWVDYKRQLPLFYHNWYGFGALDIEKAVNLAKITKIKGWKKYFKSIDQPKWSSLEDSPLVQTVNSNTNEWYYEKSFDSVTLKTGDTYGVPTADASGHSKIETGIPVVHNLYIEAVQVKLSISDDDAENYRIDLCNGINPYQSFCHTLLNPKSGIKGKLSNKTFLSNAFYGMKSGGIWHLVVRKVDGPKEGKLKNWKINFFGFRSTDDYHLCQQNPCHRTSMDGFKTSLEKEDDNWSLKLSWEPPKISGDTNWEIQSFKISQQTQKDLLCLESLDGRSEYLRKRQYGYRFEISIGSEPNKDDLYKWSFIPNNNDNDYKKEMRGIDQIYFCKNPIIALTKDHLKKAGFIPEAGGTYHINIRNINLFNDLWLERSVEELSTEWTAPDDL